MANKLYTLDEYNYSLYSHEIRLKNFDIYLPPTVSVDDFDALNDEFKIPKYETVRAIILFMAHKRIKPQLNAEDKVSGLVNIYIKACQRELSIKSYPELTPFIEEILDDLRSK